MKQGPIKRWTALVLWMALCTFSPGAPLEAAPGLINFQGELTDAVSGTAVAGTLPMTFRIYDAQTGGTLLWEEIHPSVNVQNGIYNVMLGSLQAFPSNLFSSDLRWFEAEVNGELLTPRQQMASVAFAIEAGHAATTDQASAVVTSGITTTMIQDTAVSTVKLADNAVTGAKIADGSVTSAKIVGGSGSNLDADKLDGMDAAAFGTAADVATLQATVAQLQSDVAALQNLLQHFSRNGNDITISGANLHIVNGTGTTDAANGLGNLVVGYNELRGAPNDDRTGSHNLVVGARLNYSSYGGIVAGDTSTISGAYASVSGGKLNVASGDYASVSGGYSNTASGQTSSIIGGYNNTASNFFTSVAGGWQNAAGGYNSSISGGYSNQSSGNFSSISGGKNNIATGAYASVSGGASNTAEGDYASVSGGRYNIGGGSYAFVAGGGGDQDWKGNQAFADYSAILGGFRNIAGDDLLIDHIIGLQSTISGGSYNITSGDTSSITGGWFNEATSLSSSVSGGLYNTASGWYSSVTGGESNTASGNQSAVSGGKSRSAVNDWNWVAGTLLETQ